MKWTLVGLVASFGCATQHAVRVPVPTPVPEPVRVAAPAAPVPPEAWVLQYGSAEPDADPHLGDAVAEALRSLGQLDRAEEAAHEVL